MKTRSNFFRTRTFCGLALLVLSMVSVKAADSTFTDANWCSMGGYPGANGPVNAAVVDGAGNLYIGGNFTVVGDVVANGIAKWDGANWSALGSGIGSPEPVPHVSAMVMSGGDLYVGGSFSTAGSIAALNVAKWNGSSWSALSSGTDGSVFALAVSGSDLYAAGIFTKVGGILGINVAKWNGNNWSTLGSGMNGDVSALAVSGGNLYAGGAFTTAGGISATNIAKWDGDSWSALGAGVSGEPVLGGGDIAVLALAASGSDVYAGGRFKNAGGIVSPYIAKWDGSSWSAVGAGFPPTGGSYPTVSALTVSGNELYAGGRFGFNKAGFVAKWNGTNWSALGSGMGGVQFPAVYAVSVSGTDVYAGGEFSAAGGNVANHIARWDGTNWSALASESGLGGGGSSWGNPTVQALTASGNNVYAGGSLTAAGGAEAYGIAKWNGTNWSALGLGIKYYQGDAPSGEHVSALAVLGDKLYAAGAFSEFMNRDGGVVAVRNIAQWNGTNWSALSPAPSFAEDYCCPVVKALAVLGSELYVGGYFTMAGGIGATNIAKWNGSSWSALGLGVVNDQSPVGGVNALAVSGNNLYVSGRFTMADGIPANHIAKWDGTHWSALGSGIGIGELNWPVLALAVSGNDLYAGGNYTTAGGSPASNIAKWNGTSWSALGAGLTGENGIVRALAVVGSDVYAGGLFTIAGGVAVNRLAKWNGSSWNALGSGVGGGPFAWGPTVSALAVSGSDLFVGGNFNMAGGKVSAHIARAYLLDLPALSVVRSGTDLEISWPSAETAEFALEQAGALSAPASWVSNTVPITDDGVKKSVTFPATNNPQFFRLRRP